MTAARRRVSVSLDANAARRVERAAGLPQLSPSDFLAESADERARRILADWAVVAYRAGDHTFSQLAAETGLPVEEIMIAMSSEGREESLDTFLGRCRVLAETYNNPEFLRLAERAVARERVAEQVDPALYRAVEKGMAELRRQKQVLLVRYER